MASGETNSDRDCQDFVILGVGMVGGPAWGVGGYPLAAGSRTVQGVGGYPGASHVMAAMIGARFFARRRLVGLTVTRDRTSDTRSLWLAGLHRLDGLHRLHIRSRAAFCTYLP